MYSPAFQKDIADARIEALRRAGEASTQLRRSREGATSRLAARWGLRRRAGIRRLVFAAPARAK
jgi:hypothetical protein